MQRLAWNGIWLQTVHALLHDRKTESAHWIGPSALDCSALELVSDTKRTVVSTAISPKEFLDSGELPLCDTFDAAIKV
eukprot:1324797-Amphidinium_carterae.1